MNLIFSKLTWEKGLLLPSFPSPKPSKKINNTFILPSQTHSNFSLFLGIDKK